MGNLCEGARICEALVEAENSQLRYFSGVRTGYGIPLASDGWGAFTYYIEIDDQYVTRQVNCYSNGLILRYDRTHWCDDFGFMFIGRFSRKPKARAGKSVLAAVDFERVWKEALQSMTWQEQRERSREAEWGTWADRVTS